MTSVQGRAWYSMLENTVHIHNPDGHHPVVLVCEHASHHIPAVYNNLGLSPELALSHIAWDPGALETARHLADRLDAVLVAGGVSRLLYDCNRPPSSATAMPARSEVHDVPGNLKLPAEQRQLRIERIYQPFENRLHTVLARHQVTPVLVTVHSFTPVFNGEKRQFDIGVLHDKDTRLGDAMILTASQHDSCKKYEIRRNEPYGPDDGVTHTLLQHGIANNLANVMLEVRNDLIGTAADCARMAAFLETWLLQALQLMQLKNEKAVLS